MKNQLVMITMIFVVETTLAQGLPVKKNHTQGTKVNKASEASTLNPASPPTPPAPAPKGPTGYGPVKLGMSKEAIQALQQSDGVFLSAPMTLNPPKNIPLKEGEERYEGLLNTPLSSTPLSASFRFEADQLVELYLKLDESSTMMERFQGQIEEKYGPGSVTDTRKEEQCIYKNGANFKIKSGGVFTKWIENIGTGFQAHTTILDMSIESCPSNLRYGGVGAIKVRSLSISRKAIGEEVKPKNLF